MTYNEIINSHTLPNFNLLSEESNQLLVNELCKTLNRIYGYTLHGEAAEAYLTDKIDDIMMEADPNLEPTLDQIEELRLMVRDWLHLYHETKTEERNEQQGNLY